MSQRRTAGQMLVALYQILTVSPGSRKLQSYLITCIPQEPAQHTQKNARTKYHVT